MHPIFKPPAMVALAALLTLGAAAIIIAEVVWQPPHEERHMDELTGNAERGAYLLRLGGCLSCHTNLNDAPLAGGPAFDSRYGVFHAPNITMHDQDGIGAWTIQDFARALTHGMAPDGRRYTPAFPYPFFSSLLDQDIADLWSAIQSVPVAGGVPSQNTAAFPFSNERALEIWQRVFGRPGDMVHVMGRSPAWHRGRYIARALAHCGACHTPQNLFGAPLAERRYAGAKINDTVRAPAISSAALRDNNWTRDRLVDAMRKGLIPGDASPDAAAILAIGHTMGHWTAWDREALAEYLLSGEY